MRAFPSGTWNDTQRYVRMVIDAAADLMDELCEVYADAYGEVPGEDTRVKTDAFRDRATAALNGRNYGLVAARVGDELMGFVFGYSRRQDRDWFGGLDPVPAPGFTDERGGERTLVLAEIEVRKAWQGKGIGHNLHDTFLNGRREERTATPWRSPANSRGW